MNETHFSIAAVERDVGLSKDVLRVWERRYGFPRPERDANGERVYPLAQVQRLRQIKRLMDRGHRPGRLLGLDDAALGALAAAPAAAAAQPGEADAAALPPGCEPLMALLQRHDAVALQQLLQRQLAEQGLRSFVLDTIVPTSIGVGAAWEQGTIQVFEEHLYTELATRVLRQAITAVPAGQAPTVLLTTVPDEQHGLGLLMLEALLALEGAHCVPLGTQTPLVEIAAAARAHRADAVALSFSVAYPARQVGAVLQQLRAVLPDETDLWAGGAGVRRLSAAEGVQLLPTLDDGVRQVVDWRAAQG